MKFLSRNVTSLASGHGLWFRSVPKPSLQTNPLITARIREAVCAHFMVFDGMVQRGFMASTILISRMQVQI